MDVGASDFVVLLAIAALVATAIGWFFAWEWHKAEVERARTRGIAVGRDEAIAAHVADRVTIVQELAQPEMQDKGASLAFSETAIPPPPKPARTTKRSAAVRSKPAQTRQRKQQVKPKCIEPPP